MKKHTLLILYFSILLSFTACEKEVTNIKIPQAATKLVVTAFISPQDTLLQATLTKTLPAIGKVNRAEDFITNATVTIADEEKSVTLAYTETGRLYTADAREFPVIPGKTYFLKVIHPDFPVLEASCTVPVTQNNSLEVSIDSADSRYGGGYKEYFAQMKWQDIPGEINYYRISGEVRTNGNPDYPYFSPLYFESSDLFSDVRLDGARFSSAKASVWMPPVSPDYTATNTLYAYLLNTDENYFRYHQSLRNYSNTDGNPFAEPVLIYSNISGGLGVFAAYNRASVQIELKR